MQCHRGYDASTLAILPSSNAALDIATNCGLPPTSLLSSANEFSTTWMPLCLPTPSFHNFGVVWFSSASPIFLQLGCLYVIRNKVFTSLALSAYHPPAQVLYNFGISMYSPIKFSQIWLRVLLIHQPKFSTTWVPLCPP